MADRYRNMPEVKPGSWIKVWIPKAGAGVSSLMPGWHHGIVSAVTTTSVLIIHFTRPENTEPGHEPMICETPLQWFLEGGTDEQVVDAEPTFNFAEVVNRARKYIGAGQYSLPTRNCEHFASWCYTGSAFSQQVYLVGAGAGAVALVLGVLSIASIRSQWH
jgi:hypothetical protein